MPKFISNKFTTDIMSLLTQASLIVTPNGYKEGKLYSVIPSDGSGDLSVTRATTATRVNSAGLVELVPYNLFTYSDQFDNADWSKSSGTITANATTSPNGTTTADLFTANGVLGVHDFFQGFTGGSQTTASIYVKKNTAQYVYISLNYQSSGVNWATGIYNLDALTTATFQSGGVTNQVATISDEGNGWRRITLKVDTANTTLFCMYGVSDSISPTLSSRGRVENSSSASFYAWGAQLVEGSVAKDYQKTETRLNIPRLDYSNGTCPSILVEPQRTNSCINSNTFNASGWNANGIASYTKVANPITGMNDATKIVKTTGNSDPYFQQGVGAANGTWTYSMWLWTDSGQPTTAAFYMFNSTVTEFFALPITLTNVPTRYTFTSTFANTGGLIFIRTVLSGADANQYIYAYGGQVEAGSYATSYIPTTSASVTRNADVISKTGISSLIGQTEGTLFLDLNFKTPSGTTEGQIAITDNSGDNRVIIWNNFSLNTLGLQIKANGTNAINNVSLGSFVDGTRYKIAVAYNSGDTSVYVNGTQVISNTATFSFVSSLTDFILGGYYLPYDGHQLANASALWKTRLTNTQLEALTGPGFNTYAEMAEYYNYVLQ